jgi:hypothetical protein
VPFDPLFVRQALGHVPGEWIAPSHPSAVMPAAPPETEYRTRACGDRARFADHMRKCSALL